MSIKLKTLNMHSLGNQIQDTTSGAYNNNIIINNENIICFLFYFLIKIDHERK